MKILLIYSNEFLFSLNSIEKKLQNYKLTKININENFFKILFYVLIHSIIITNSENLFFLYKILNKKVILINYNYKVIKNNYFKIFSTFPIKNNFIPSEFFTDNEYNFSTIKHSENLTILLESKALIKNLTNISNYKFLIGINAKNIKNSHFVLCSSTIENIAKITKIGRPCYFIAKNNNELENLKYVINSTNMKEIYKDLNNFLNNISKNEELFYNSCSIFNKIFIQNSTLNI